MLGHAIRRREQLTFIALLSVAVLTLFTFSNQPSALAQPTPAEEVGPSTSDVEAPLESDTPTELQNTKKETKKITVFYLITQGGWPFMVVLGLMSLMVVTIAIERLLALRRQRVMPADFINEIGKLGEGQGEFDPRQAYRLCQKFTSTTSNVIRAMLLKVGRPHSEVEHAVREVSEREADRLYTNVRWLNLAAAVAPLIGLLGTVWGLIQAFYDSTNLERGKNMADQLAGGIWTALITTLFGLTIAIFATVFAHYFEGRITALFHQIDEMLFNLLPQVERYEGRVRFNRQETEIASNGNQTTGTKPATSPK